MAAPAEGVGKEPIPAFEVFIEDVSINKDDIKWQDHENGTFSGEVKYKHENKMYTLKISGVKSKGEGSALFTEQARRCLGLAISSQGPIKVTGDHFKELQRGEITGGKPNWQKEFTDIGTSSDLSTTLKYLERQKKVLEKMREYDESDALFAAKPEVLQTAVFDEDLPMQTGDNKILQSLFDSNKIEKSKEFIDKKYNQITILFSLDKTAQEVDQLATIIFEHIVKDYANNPFDSTPQRNESNEVVNDEDRIGISDEEGDVFFDAVDEDVGQVPDNRQQYDNEPKPKPSE